MRDEFMRSIKDIATAAGASREAVRNLEQQVRREFGGKSVYIAKSRTPTRIASLSMSIAAGKPIAVVFAEHGIPRSTGYRLLRKN